MQPTVEQLCEAMERHHLLSSADLAAVRTRWFQPNRKDAGDPVKFCQWLVLNKDLTEFAVRLLLAGQADQLALNQYKLRDQLKSGPLAGAYLGTDPLLRPVVIEVLAPSHARDPGTLSAFQRSAQLAMQVQHPNVERTVDQGQARGLHYLVKEYYEGETLAEVLRRRGKLPFVQTTRIFALALAGLQALHEHAVPPGELEPDCLILTADKEAGGKKTVKILHVGVKRVLLDNTAIGTDGEGMTIPDEIKLAKSFIFKPAEVAKPRPAVDLFRLGCAFYHCLTGRPAYAPEDLPEPRHPAPPVRELAPDVPETLAETIEQMIDPDPQRRPTKAAHVAKSLRVFLAAEEETREAPVEENIAPPVSPSAPKPAREEEEPDEPEEKPHAARRRQAEANADGDEPPSKLAEVWEEVRPKERDLAFLGAGAVSIIAVVLLLKMITGWQFVNLICLLTGGALAFSVERFIQWREGQRE